MAKVDGLQEVTEASSDAMVAQLFELGWFDVEFTMYGCAYLEDGKVFYKASPAEQDIYAFIEKSANKSIFPSNVMEYTVECPVPSGMKQMIAQDVKVDLGKQLREAFPQEFLELLYELGVEATNNTCAEQLWEEADQLEGKFDENLLRLFEDKVHFVHSCRHLNEAEYKKLLAWIAEERKNMEDSAICKDIFEKTMYGIAYEENGKIKHIENARLGYVYRKAHLFERQGKFVTPVFYQTYWYNYKYRLPDVLEDFHKELLEECGEAYRNEVKAIKHSGSGLTLDRFNEAMAEVKEKYGNAAAETLTRYGYRWGVLK